MATARMKAQKRLTAFVRIVAFMERTGNGFGRLLLIWATVVVGFSKKLGEHFWFLAAIIILESFRAFSRESKSDDQLLFKTTGGIKIKRVPLPVGSLYYVNTMIITSCWFGFIISHIPFYPASTFIGGVAILPLVVLLNKASELLVGLPKLIEKISRPKSSCRFIPPLVLLLDTIARLSIRDPTNYFIILLWLGFYSLGRFQLPAARPCLPLEKFVRVMLIIGIVGGLVYEFKNVGILTMVAPLVLGNFQIPLAVTRILFGLALLLVEDFHDLEDTNKGTHIVQTLKAVYIMLICQGALYILACLFESLSYFFRASLAVHCGLVDKMGMESIDLYYEQAYETFVQESLLDTKKMSLVTFAVDSVNGDVTRDKKLAAVQILNSFLQQEEEASNREVASQVTASTKAVSTLISMLGWTVPEGASHTEEKEGVKDSDVRLFSAKVVAYLSPYLRIAGIPGTMQAVSSLLDAENNPAREDSLAQAIEGSGGTGVQEIRSASSHPRVEGNRGTAAGQQTEGNGGTADQEIPRVDGDRGTADSQEEIQEMSHAPAQAGDIEQGNADNQPQMQDSAAQAGDLEQGNADNQPLMQNSSAQNADNQPSIQDSSAQASGVSEESSRIHKCFLFFQKGAIWICKCWQHMKDIWSIPRDSLKDEDSIPVLGVLILERLAHDVDNCAEISRSTQILPKIIGFISHITDTTTKQQKQIITSSLILVAKLASVKGEIGVTLRENLYKNPLLLSKLAEISEDGGTGPEKWNLTMDIIAKLAMNEEARQDIGGTQVIIAKLMRTFLGQDESPNTSNDPSLRKAAGEALAMLSMDAHSCSVMLNEQGNQLTKNLMDMLLIRDPDGEYVYPAANLLQSMCTHLGNKLRHQDPNQDILFALPAVLERIMKPDSEGKQLEALIGLASRIFTFSDEGEIENMPLPGDEALAKKLVAELNANKRPSTEIPNMRRRLVELAISMVETRNDYREAFRRHGMMDALSMVEKTPSKVERYRLFSGGTGLVPEGAVTLSNLVAEAKGLMIEPAAQAAQ